MQYYGVAPKAKADFAFLLHDLYHLEDDGIMTIVLPHGVLFRGGDEATIRENLIEKNNIDASKDFEKSGKNNKLRACDIKKIADTVKNRTVIEKYSAIVSKETIRENEYNLNISRYVDSSDEPERWDIRSTMFGGIPKVEVEELHDYWEAFPGLREALFENISEEYMQVKVENIREMVEQFTSVDIYKKSFETAFDGLYDTLQEDLIDGILDVSIEQETLTLPRVQSISNWFLHLNSWMRKVRLRKK